MAIEEKFKEKLFYEQELTVWNSRAVQARIYGSADLYFEIVMAIYDYLIPSVQKLIRQDVEAIIFERDKQLKTISFERESPLSAFDFKMKQDEVTRSSAKKIHRLIIWTLDKKNLMLKRRDIMVGYEERLKKGKKEKENVNI